MLFSGEERIPSRHDELVIGEDVPEDATVEASNAMLPPRLLDAVPNPFISVRPRPQLNEDKNVRSRDGPKLQ